MNISESIIPKPIRCHLENKSENHIQHLGLIVSQIAAILGREVGNHESCKISALGLFQVKLPN
jgi:hypothetical protein